MDQTTKNKWYQDGLAFSCRQCGKCCSGPDEGYVWFSSEEIAAAADLLGLDRGDFKRQYLERVGLRHTIIEKQPSKDCIFLTWDQDGKVGCKIYSARPVQCRTWPFWPENLRSARTWTRAAGNCPGMNQGHFFTLEQIEAIRQGDLPNMNTVLDGLEPGREWIKANLGNRECLEEIEQLYRHIDGHIESSGAKCDNCGQCCDFAGFGHKLYVTTLEMLYFWSGQGKLDFPHPAKGRCPCQLSDSCRARQFRPSGCRIFYCRDLSCDFQQELSEQVLARLRAMHEKFHAPYHYAELMEWLK